MEISKPKLKRLLRLLGPILFAFLVIRVVDPKTAAGVLRQLRPEILLASVLLFPVTNAAVTTRWWLICRRLGIEISFRELFNIYYISWFLSAIPFVGISPLAKLLYLKEEGKSATHSAVSITLDKLFDVIGLMFFGLFGLVYFPHGLLKQTYLWIVIAGALLAAFIFWLFGNKIGSFLMELFKRYTNRKLRTLGTKLEEDLKGFWSQFNTQLFFVILSISIAIGVVRALVLYILAISLNLYVSFGLMVACRAIIGIVNVIPITISGLGTRDAILLLALPVYGVSKEAAIALGFVAFLWTLCSKFSGIFFWLKHPLPSNSLLGIKEKLTS